MIHDETTPTEDLATSEGTQPDTATTDLSSGAEPATAPEEPTETAAPEPAAEEPAPEPVPAPEPEPAPAPEPVVGFAPVDTSGKTEDELLFEAEMAKLDNRETQQSDSNYKKLTKGDRVEATVIQVEKDRVFVDLGTKSEGVVPLGELTEENVESAEGLVKVGDRIQVVVIRPEGSEGNPIVSKKRADFEEAWNRIVASFQEGKMLTAQVIDRVKGGLVVDIGVRGFVPATHVGSGKLRNIEKYVGQPINLKIIEIDRERKKVVLSNRQAEEEKRAEVKEQIFSKVAPGDILEGTVRRLTDYGAFVDLGGIDGLLHISEMSWMRISHPREVLKDGQKIKVMVLRLDPVANKISLGLRQVLPDPWNLIRENYKIGQKFVCQVNRLVQSGAFVKLPEGAEAFLPVSEISNRRIGKPSDVLTEGQDIEPSIIDLRPDERRMVLSLRGGSVDHGANLGQERSGGGGYYGGGETDDDRPRGKKGAKKRRGGGRSDDDDFDTGFVGRVPTGGATIGERLGILKGFITRNEDEEETEAEPEAESTEPASEEPTEE